MESIQIHILFNGIATKVLRASAGKSLGWMESEPGGLKLIEVVSSYLVDERHALASPHAIKNAILGVGSAIVGASGIETSIGARNLITGLPTKVSLTTPEITPLITDVLQGLANDVAYDINYNMMQWYSEMEIDPYIVLGGEFRSLRNLDKLLESAIRRRAFPDARVIIKEDEFY